MPPPVLDKFGRIVDEQLQDYWPARTGVAMALAHLAPLFPMDQLLPLFHFFVPKGLGDRSAEVRSQMRQAALAAINVHGKVRRIMNSIIYSVKICTGIVHCLDSYVCDFILDKRIIFMHLHQTLLNILMKKTHSPETCSPKQRTFIH